MDDLEISPTLTISASELSWTAVRASGPGGQNVNKVSSKVDLRFDLEACTSLREPVKARLRALARGQLDADGCVFVISQATRDQARNLEDARNKLAELIRRALVTPKKRKATRPTRGATRRRLEGKRRQGDKKKSRGRVGPED